MHALLGHAYRTRGNTLAEKYDNTKSRIERITQAGYQVKVQWECEFELPEDMKVETVYH